LDITKKQKLSPVPNRSTSFRFPFDLILGGLFLSLLICQFTKDLDTFGACIFDSFGQNLHKLFKPETSEPDLASFCVFCLSGSSNYSRGSEKPMERLRLPFRRSFLYGSATASNCN